MFQRGARGAARRCVPARSVRRAPRSPLAASTANKEHARSNRAALHLPGAHLWALARTYPRPERTTGAQTVTALTGEHTWIPNLEPVGKFVRNRDTCSVSYCINEIDALSKLCCRQDASLIIKLLQLIKLNVRKITNLLLSEVLLSFASIIS